jgi:AAA+ superfamily predicted ATPase
LAYELGLPVGLLRLSAVISSFLGDTASHLQRVFNLANTTPMVLLLDEVDAVGKNRDDPNDVGELKRVVNSLLQAMDSFDSSKSIVIAASNHQYLLDPALWRRFDDLIEFSLPTKTEREFYLQSLLNGVYFDGSLEYIAKNMSSLSYADIQRITIEAIKTMILEGREQLQSQDISEQLKAFKKASSEARTKTRIIV